MGQFEQIVALLAVVVALAALAKRLHFPYPMFLLVWGIVVALLPWISVIELEPDLALVLFLPPVLFEAAYNTSWRDFRANIVYIGGLAIGAVLVTTVIVALLARMLFDGIPWAMAFALGAIVSPPDTVAASTIFRRLGVPNRITTILEGESLVNDASALVTYQVAVAAVVSGMFSASNAAGQFVLVGGGGIAIGMVCGYLVARIVETLPIADLEIAATLIAPYLVYIGAERAHVSGVLAVVACGLIFGRRSSRALSSASRVGGLATWQAGLILINGTGFILIGMQLQQILDTLNSGEFQRLLINALVISLGVIIARFLWIGPVKALQMFVTGNRNVLRDTEARKSAFVIAWSGLRGIVSLAAALALPVVDDAGVEVPYRSEVQLVTFVVICVTLLGQGLSLPFVLRKLDIHDDGENDREVGLARRIAIESGLETLNTIADEPWIPEGHVSGMRERFQHILDSAPTDRHVVSERAEQAHLTSVRRLNTEVFESARQALIDARDRGEIGDAARTAIESDLDLELLRFDA